MSDPIYFPEPDFFNQNQSATESPIVEAYLHPSRIQGDRYNASSGFITTITSQYVIVDAAGNGNVCNWKLTFINYNFCTEDKQPCQFPPVNTFCPQPTHVWCHELNETCDCVYWDEPQFEDYNNDIVKIEKSHELGRIFPLGQNTITYTAIDSLNQTATCMFDIYIIDNKPPQWEICPSDDRISTDAGAQDVNYEFEVKAYDDCVFNTEITYKTGTWPYSVEYLNHTDHPNADELLVPGKYWFRYEARDEKGNVNICTWEIEVYDG